MVASKTSENHPAGGSPTFYYKEQEKNYLWGFEGIVRREMDDNKEDTTGVRTVIRPHNGRLPVKHVSCYRTCMIQNVAEKISFLSAQP